MNNVHHGLFQTTDIVDGFLIVGGLTISLQDIQQILSIIILVVDIIWILFKCGYKTYKHIKNGGDPSDMDNDIEKAKEDIKNKGGR